MSYKIQKLNELIKQVLGQIILENEEFGQGVFVTIMAVETSVDGQHSRVTISVYPEKKAETAFTILNRHVFEIQQSLNKKLQMRPVPKIRFVLDKTESEAQHVGEFFTEKEGDT